MTRTHVNQSIGDEITAAGLFDYQVAARIGITTAAFREMMRGPLPDEQAARIRAAIQNNDKGVGK